MTNNKLFSIIIPCFNVEKYIDECLDSLLNQTIGIDKFEIILVDDCSTDNTVNILKKYEKEYPDLFVLIILDKNGRQGYARNVGMQYATGKYISFVDADDFVRTDMYKILKSIVDNHEVDVVQFRYQIVRNENVSEYKSKINNNKEFRIALYDYEKNRKKYLLNNNILNESCTQKIYLREIILKSQLYFGEGVAYEEPLFTYPIKFLVKSVAVLEENLYYYRENIQGTTLSYMSNPNTILDHLNVQLQLREFIKNMPEAHLYDKETELYFLHAFYVETFYFMKKRGWVMPLGMWRYLKQEVLTNTPGYIDNEYLNDISLAEDKMLLDLLLLNDVDDMGMQNAIINAMKLITV